MVISKCPMSCIRFSCIIIAPTWFPSLQSVVRMGRLCCMGRRSARNTLLFRGISKCPHTAFLSGYFQWHCYISYWLLMLVLGMLLLFLRSFSFAGTLVRVSLWLLARMDHCSAGAIVTSKAFQELTVFHVLAGVQKYWNLTFSFFWNKGSVLWKLQMDQLSRSLIFPKHHFWSFRHRVKCLPHGNSIPVST